MSITRRLNSEGIVETLAQSPVNLTEALTSIQELQEYIRDGRLFEIVVTEGDGKIHIGYQGGRSIASSAVSLFQSLETVVIALVAQNDAGFGACRQMQSLMESANPRMVVSVFRDQSLAMEWLRQEKRAVEEAAEKILPAKQVVSE